VGRAVIDELVEEALHEFADERSQRVLWQASHGPEASSFIECYERLFTDSGLGTALGTTEVVYDPMIDGELRELNAVLARIDGSRPPGEILDDPLMVRVRHLAAGLPRTLSRGSSRGVQPNRHREETMAYAPWLHLRSVVRDYWRVAAYCVLDLRGQLRSVRPGGLLQGPVLSIDVERDSTRIRSRRNRFLRKYGLGWWRRPYWVALRQSREASKPSISDQSWTP
jgi:hypothetical protein